MSDSYSQTHIFLLIWLFRALLFSFLVCGALAYVLIILYDSQEIDASIKDHVETEFVSDGNVSKIHEQTKARFSSIILRGKLFDHEFIGNLIMPRILYCYISKVLEK